MKTALILASTLTAASIATVAEARTSSNAEFRGYSTCLAAAAEQSKGLVPARHYYIEKHVDESGVKTQYYINATRWVAGERDYARIDCTTAARGHRLVAAQTEPGRYTIDRGQVTVELAGN